MVKKHSAISIKQKLEIIKLADKGVSKKVLAEEFGIGASTVFQIYRKKDKILKYLESTSSLTNIEERTTMHQLTYHPSLDNELKAWFDREKAKGNSVTGEMILDKAKQLNRQLEGGNSENYEFNPTLAFVYAFKKRFGIGKSGMEKKGKSGDGSFVEEKNDCADGVEVKSEEVEEGEEREEIGYEGISHDEGLAALDTFIKYSQQYTNFYEVTYDLLNHLKEITQVNKASQEKLHQ